MSSVPVSAVCVVCIAVWHRMLLLFVVDGVAGAAFIITNNERDAKWAVFLVPNSSPFILGPRAHYARPSVPKLHYMRTINSAASPANALANRNQNSVSKFNTLYVCAQRFQPMFMLFVSCSWQRSFVLICHRDMPPNSIKQVAWPYYLLRPHDHCNVNQFSKWFKIFNFEKCYLWKLYFRINFSVSSILAICNWQKWKDNWVNKLK